MIRKEINDIPDSMSFLDGFTVKMPCAEHHNYCDYKEMFKLLKSINYKFVEYIVVGLAGDMDCTGSTIYENGVFNKDSYFYDSSRWAEPCIVIYYLNKPVETYYLSTPKKQKNNIKKLVKLLIKELKI